MFDLFDEDYIFEMYVKDRQREAAKGMYEKKFL